MSMFTRVLIGFTGVLILIMLLVSMFHGDFSFLWHGKYGWIMPFLPIAFIVYAIGGQTLLRKYLPYFAEKDKTTNVDESDKK